MKPYTGCAHEDDITYGKAIQVTPTQHVVHILCENCGAVGSQLEELSDTETDHYEPMQEIWHDPQDYYNDTIASHKVIGLREK